MADGNLPQPERRKAATPKQIAEILIRQDGRCPHCDAKLGGGVPYHIDHIQPLDLLGSNAPDNLQALCEPCHKSKTKADIALIAKGRRIRKKNDPGTRPEPKMRSAASYRWPKRPMPKGKGFATREEREKLKAMRERTPVEEAADA